MTMNSAENELIERARWITANPARRGVRSSGQMIQVALMLNKPRWLAEAGFTLADALPRLTHTGLDAVIATSRNPGNHSGIGAQNQ